MLDKSIAMPHYNMNLHQTTYSSRFFINIFVFIQHLKLLSITIESPLFDIKQYFYSYVHLNVKQYVRKWVLMKEGR